MIQRDFLQDQIEQLGKVLAKMLAYFLDIQTPAEFSSRMESIEEQLQKELEIELPELLTREKEGLKAYLLDKNLNGDHLDTLSKLLEAMGRQQRALNLSDSRTYLERALTLIELSDEVSGVLSFEKIERQRRIKEILREA